MSQRLYRLLVERAKHFFEEAGFDAEKGRYDIALFHLEQASQLAVKAYMLRVYGTFPRVHSLLELFEASGSPCLKQLAEEKWFIIDILDEAYTGARYYPRTYGRREYEEAKRLVLEVFKCVGIAT